MPQVSLARVKTWMRASNVERAPSRSFGGWGVRTAVETGGEDMCCEEEGEPRLFVSRKRSHD